ncbi:hypothetical protein GCM10009661_76120 [Catellatospora chokoriensis]|uniref:Uncharacterized protein n=1 Tax=Catellatospora chokoriensis TaxID=310353 RepID=A0A8J3NW26_9ACTN|nr:hypothetical protein Cch02nite_81490 [Catellatospora chokoriensis]
MAMIGFVLSEPAPETRRRLVPDRRRPGARAWDAALAGHFAVSIAFEVGSDVAATVVFLPAQVWSHAITLAPCWSPDEIPMAACSCGGWAGAASPGDPDRRSEDWLTTTR